MIKCELIIEGYSYRVTDDVKNWDDIVVSVNRSDYGGVLRSFSSKFEFVNKAHALIKKQYREKYLNSSASVVFSRRNNSWEWNEIFRCELDFSSYSDSGNEISINAIDNSLASIIKAKKSTEYEYSVDVIKENEKLYYDRLSMMSSFNFTFSDTFTISPIDDNVDLIVSSFNNEVSEGGYIEPDTNEKGVVANLINVPNEGIDITLNIDVEYENTGDGSYVTVMLSSVGKTIYSNINKGESKNILFNIRITKSDFDSFPEKKRIYMSITMKSSTGKLTYAVFNINKINEFTARYSARSKPENIDVISPNKLLNRLLKSMNGGNDGLIGEIDSDNNNRLENCIIIAAESIRGIKQAKLYSSFSKFSQWMKAAFGYVYDIDGKKVTFRDQSKYFPEEIAKEIEEYNEFSYDINSSIIYSSVRVGYEKKDYENVNGRDEFRFTNTFSTGVSLTDNTLDLISPYRADAYGIEFLSRERGNDTTDKESDSDVFFVGSRKVSRPIITPEGIQIMFYQYELVRYPYTVSGVISPTTMFNAMYSPRQMLIANMGFIGACTNLLSYTSSEGNSDVSINGVYEKDDLQIPESERLFTVGEITFSTPDYEIPENKIALVALNKSDERYIGYMIKSSMNVGKEESNKYTLAIKKIE